MTQTIRRPTDADARLMVILFRAGRPYKAIARRVGWTQNRVSDWLCRRGLRRKGVVCPRQAAAAYRQHGSVRAAANALGVGYSACRDALARAGVRVRRTGFGWTGPQRRASVAAGWPPVVESERAILALLHDDPLLTAKEIAGTLGRNLTGTRDRLRILAEAGHVVRVPSNLGTLYDLTQGVRCRRTAAVNRKRSAA